MANRDGHLRQAERFEAFLQQINTPTQPYREWVVIASFHIVLHYVDAFLASKGHDAVGGHSGRWAQMANYAETRDERVFTAYQRLYKDAKEARYEGGEYTPMDLASIESRYNTVRSAMRKALGLSLGTLLETKGAGSWTASRPLWLWCEPERVPGECLYPRIGAALGVPVDEPGDAARAIIIGELTRRVASERSM